MALPPWISAEENKPAPMPLLLVQGFLNTREHDTGRDALLEAGPARDWLTAAGLWWAARVPEPDELRQARAVREAVRALLDRNADGPVPTAEQLSPLRRLAQQAELAFAVEPDGAVQLTPRAGGQRPAGEDGRAGTGGQPAAAPGSRGPDGAGTAEQGGRAPAGDDQLTTALGRLLLIIRDAQRDGAWARLKTCGNPGCRWAFFDRSHSRRGNWCDMATCGNRMKNRMLRQRRRADRAG